jgi:DNA-directed RNA polymerase II subunit RPB1
LIIPNVNLLKVGDKNKDGSTKWESGGDKNILIQKGELHCGILTKGTIGNSSGGLIHIIWKEYGPDACRDFLSNT